MLKERLIDSYKNSRYKKPLTKVTHQSGVLNPSCGDAITIHLHVENNTICDIFTKTQGCALSVATAHLLAEYIDQKNVNFVYAITPEKIQSLVGTQLGPLRLQCALLALEATKNALNSFNQNE